MKKIWFICLGIIFAVFFLTVVLGVYNSEPRYKGRSAAVWALDLNSSEQKNRDEAVLALQKIGSNGVPSLSRMLVTTNRSWQDRALLSTAPYLPRPLRSRVYEKHYPVDPFTARVLAAKALGTIGTEARTAIPILNELVADQQMQGTLSYATAVSLAKMGKESVPTLTNDLQSKNSFVVQKAIYALSTMGSDSKEAIPALIRQLTSQDAAICDSAKRAISGLGSSATPTLIEILHNGSPEERALAAKALSMITLTSADTIQNLIGALDDSDPKVRRQIIETLGSLRAGYTPVTLALSRSLQDTNEEVRLEAVKMLGRVPRRAEPAIPELSRLLNDPNEGIRSAAGTVLMQITNRPPAQQTR